MILETPKEKTFIWILAIVQLFLIPVYYYLYAKFSFDYGFLSQKISVTHVLITSFVALLVCSTFIVPFIIWATKSYLPEKSLFHFNRKRMFWSLFWTFLIFDWMFVELFWLFKSLESFYFPEAINIAQSSLLIYLFLCLRTLIVAKSEKSKLDVIMACFTLLFTIIIQTIIFL